MKIKLNESCESFMEKFMVTIPIVLGPILGEIRSLFALDLSVPRKFNFIAPQFILWKVFAKFSAS